MGNIATGIGLSGKLETDNSGQANRLAAEKAAAGQRLSEQGERRKERDALESEVRKNMFIKNDLNMPFYQRDWANRSAATLTDIVEGVSTGDMTKAQAYGKMHEFNNYANSIKKADEQLYNSFEEVRKNPMKYDWSGSRMFGGKEVNSIFEALDDPYANTPEGMQELAANFGGAEYQFKQSKPEEVAMGMPERVVNFMPTPMTDPLDASLALAKDKALYTELREGKAKSFDPRTQKLMKEYGYGMNEDGVGMIRDEVLGNASVMRSYEKRLREEYKKQNPGATDADFMKTDWMSQVPQLYEAEIASSLRNRLEGRSLKEATIEDAETKSTSGALFGSKKVDVFNGEDIIKAQEVQPWEQSSPTGQKYQYLAVAPIQPKTSGLSMNIDIKPGTLYWDKELNGGKGALRAPDNYESTEKVIPHEMVFMSDGEKGRPYIRYLLAVSAQAGGNESDPFATATQQDRFKTRNYESFYVPATEENLKRLAAVTETGIDEWNKLKVDLGNRASSGRQAASSGNQGVNQGGKKESATTSLTSNQQGALSAFESQMGRPPTESERVKILEKFK